MSWVAAAVAGSAVVGAGISLYEGQQGRDAQTSAANSANQTQTDMYNQTRADQAPYRDAGVQALDTIQNDPSFNQNFNMSDFQQDPGYQFRMQQGQQAIERSAAARGGLNSGDTMKALTKYNQGEASNEYQNAYNRYTTDQSNRFNRLASVAGIGQTAVGQTTAAGTSTGNQISANQTAVGNANAAQSVAAGNTVNSAMGTGMNTWMNYNLMNRAFPQQTEPQPTGGGGGSPSYLLE